MPAAPLYLRTLWRYTNAVIIIIIIIKDCDTSKIFGAGVGTLQKFLTRPPVRPQIYGYLKP